MPDINSRLEILTGRGTMFLTDDLAIGQRELSEGWRVCTWPLGGAHTKVAEQGCNAIAARGGQWLAQIGSGVFPHREGVLAGSGLLMDLQGARGLAADDGTIGLVLDYQDGLGLRLLASDGSFVDVPDARVRGDQACVVSRSQAFWMENGQPRAIGMAVPKVLPGPVYWPRILGLAGQWWITYHSTDERGVVLHPFDSFDGYQITGPPAFYVAAVVVDGKAAIAWGVGADDERAHSRVVDVTTEPRQSLLAAPEPTPEPKPDPKPEELPVPNLKDIVESHWQSHGMDAKQVAAWKSGGKPAIQRLQMQWFARLTPVVQAALPKGWLALWEKYRNPVPGTEWFWLPDQFLLVDPHDVVHSVKVIAGAGEAIHREHNATSLDGEGNVRYAWVFGVPAWSDQGVPKPENYTVDKPLAEPKDPAFFGPFAGGGDNGDPGDEDHPKPPIPPVEPPKPACDCAKLTAKVEELEELLLDMAKAADERFVKLETAQPPEFVLPALVARGKNYGLKFELPVEKV